MYVCNTPVSHGGEKGVGLGDVWTPETERAWPKGWTRLSYWWFVFTPVLVFVFVYNLGLGDVWTLERSRLHSHY